MIDSPFRLFPPVNLSHKAINVTKKKHPSKSCQGTGTPNLEANVINIGVHYSLEPSHHR